MLTEEALGTLTVLVHLAAATAVTLHVLLHKRDVGATVSWIGLAWLSPVVGSALYWLIGINRVRRRALRLERPSIRTTVAAPGAPLPTALRHLVPLEIAGWRITRRRAEPGNRIDILHDGEGAYPRMIAAIAAAERTVGLSTYIFRDDTAGQALVRALADAQRRGVAVRVLIDGFGGGYLASPVYRRLHALGVPAARFLHSEKPWRMPFLNMRTHKKILVADGSIAFTGGLNIGDENLPASQPRHPVRDTHFEVAGPVVGQLVEAFCEDWLFTTGETLEGAGWYPEPAPAGDAIARAITSGPDQDLEKLEFILLGAIADARRSIRIVTPYFLPDERLLSALSLAAFRGVEVDIALPSRSNHRLVDWAARAQMRPLLEAGCRVWHQPSPFDHSKLMVVDGAWCLIGSANWDMRSLRLNFEVNVEVYCTDFGTRLDRAIEPKLGRRVTLAELDGRGFPIRLRDAAVRLLLPYL
jgi:cardiolipin synthase